MRPVTDEKLCFVCQERDPVWQAMNQHSQTFRLCNECASAVRAHNDTNNRIKESLSRNDRLGIFTKTLGFNLLPTKITLTKLDVY